MPHLIIESSQALSSDVVKDLHHLVGEQETVSMAAVKTRCYTPAFSQAGEQNDNEHTAITLKLLPGRSPTLKEQIAANLYERAKGLISEGTLSVEIVDLGVYKK